MIGGALRRIVSFKSKQRFLPSNYILLNLDFVKFSLDKGDLTGYYIHNGKSVRLQTLFFNALNYDWFIQSIFISNPLLTRFLVIVHHSNHCRWWWVTGLGNGCRGNSWITPTITFVWMLSNFLLTKATWHDTIFIMENPCAYRPYFPTVLTMIYVIMWLTMIRSFNQSSSLIHS